MIGRCSATAVPIEPLADLEAEVFHDLGRVSDRVRDAQISAPFVEQIHREHAEAGEPRDELRDLFEELVDIEDGGDLAAKLEERRQQLGVGDRAGDDSGRHRISHGLSINVVVLRFSPKVYRVTHS